MMRILFVSDPMGSGYGTQAENVLTILNKTQDVEVVWGFINNPSPAGIMMHNGIKCFNFGAQYNDLVYNMYHFITKQKFDVICLHQDPHFIEFFYRHIRPIIDIPTVYWHLWDNDPFPESNMPIYESSDMVIAGSMFTYKLLKDRVKNMRYVPLCVNTKKYYPIEDKYEKRDLNAFVQRVDKRLLKGHFVIGSVQRNIARKRMFDLIGVFNKMREDIKDILLVLRTNPYDPHGFPLLTISDDDNILFVADQLPVEDLNRLYNTFDVHVDIARAEGFGVTPLEALSAGIPNIVSATGGLTHNISASNWGTVIKPSARMMVGNQEPVRCIYDDYISTDDLYKQLKIVYHRRKPKIEDKRDMHKYVMNNFSIENTVVGLYKAFESVSGKKVPYQECVCEIL